MAYPPPKIGDLQVTGSIEDFDPQEMENICKECPRFRILIIGRANSGKTTIIKKMCDNDNDPVLYDEDGDRLPTSGHEDPDAMRDTHEIDLEITHENNPNFVFHNSMGFEAGSAEGIEKVRSFIDARLKRTDLKERLHAIWYCIPTDYNRVASEAELSFFKQSTGDVPVVLIFTKWDGQVILSCSKLRGEGKEIKEAKEEAPQHATAVLEKHYLPVFKKEPYPPASYVVLADMDRPETKCGELSEKTAAALKNGALKKLFVSAQTQSLDLCMKSGVQHGIWRRSQPGCTDDDIIRSVLSWFPHVHNHGEIPTLFGPVTSSAFQTSLPAPFQGLNLVACAAIVADRSFQTKQNNQSARDAIQSSIKDYLASPQCAAVTEAIKSRFHQYAETPVTGLMKGAREEICKSLLELCLSNRLK